MDFQRAKEIIQSEDTIKVLYHGSPIWITGLDPSNQTANVRVLNSPEQIISQVPVRELEEQ